MLLDMASFGSNANRWQGRLAVFEGIQLSRSSSLRLSLLTTKTRLLAARHEAVWGQDKLVATVGRRAAVCCLLMLAVGAGPSLGQDADRTSGTDCTISWADVRARQAANLVMVDTRATDDFARFSVPGSVNLPLYALRHKQFLKDKVVVVIGDPVDWQRATQLCSAHAESSASGFYVVRGGISAVEDSGHAGDTPAWHAVTAREFVADRVRNPWLVVDYTGRYGSLQASATYVDRTWVDASNRLPVAVVAEVRRHLRSAPSTRVLILRDDQPTGAQEALERVARDGGGMFYLEGGVESYERFLRDRRAMIAQKETVRTTALACEWVR